MTRSRDPRAWPPRSGDDFRQEAVVRLGENLADRFAQIRLLVFDADGVLTPGNLIYGPRGEAYKEFHAHDGFGLVLARAAGLKRAVLTGRNSTIVERRTTELRFDSIKLGRFDKLVALHEILVETGVAAAATLYVGDDLIDLPAMFEAGVAVAVPGAPAEVREHCDYVTTLAGGAGAVREVCDLVLKSAGIFGDALRRVGDKAWMPTPAELSSDDDGGGTPPEVLQ